MSSTESIAAASEHASTLDSEAVGETAPKVLEVQELKKTFFIGFFRKRVEAVRGVNFTVRQGETFGLLGPNGAGKTTTIKMLLRLIYPTSGSIRLFDQALGSRIVQSRIGYLPENPYVYDYLNPIEFLDLCGRLMGMSAAQRRTRTTDILERVGLSHAKDRRIGKFSKGMTQRVGLAQALLHEPELLILDEPM
ncbi:MAG: ABC transporter ATP-binding protein, partial [Myxococcota bacterium]